MSTVVSLGVQGARGISRMSGSNFFLKKGLFIMFLNAVAIVQYLSDFLFCPTLEDMKLGLVL